MIHSTDIRRKGTGAMRRSTAGSMSAGIDPMAERRQTMDHLKTGEVISKRRRELGLTQNQLAKTLNISFQAVSKWENGTAYPDIEMLPRLAAALNTTVDALLGYRSVVTDYDKRYEAEEYYWGLQPNRICYDIMK